MSSCSLIRAFLILCDPIYSQEAQRSHKFLPQLDHIDKTSHILKYDFPTNSVYNGIKIIFNAFKMENLSVFCTIGTNEHRLIHLYPYVCIYSQYFSYRMHSPTFPSAITGTLLQNLPFFPPTLGQMLLYCTMIVLFLKTIM